MAETDFPKARLANGDIEVSIHLPDAERGYYRGTRFDWSGIIESVDYNAAAVRNQITGAAVSFEGDAPIERMVFWAVERAACPEPFSRIRLDPGEATNWSSTYRFSADSDQGSQESAIGLAESLAREQ